MDYVVTADWLQQNLHNSEVVVIDCRFALADPLLGQQQYLAGHIPSASHLDLNQDLSAPVQTHGGRHPLPNMIEFANKLAHMGINFGQTLVVAYDDSKLAFAARLWWLLRYCGHDRVAVLDGGYQHWLQKGYGVTADRPAARRGQFTPQVRRDWTVDINDIKAVASERANSPVVLIDSREADRYAGLVEPIDPVAGHIPGAVNYPWAAVTDDQNLLLPLAEQQHRWVSLPAEQTKIVYCGSGVTACVNLLSMAIAGVPDTLLYPGSWSDWCSYQ
jgi:thiosulfate/3-mercaptopyruvate sulfurtransferase